MRFHLFSDVSSSVIVYIVYSTIIERLRDYEFFLKVANLLQITLEHDNLSKLTFSLPLFLYISFKIDHH